MILGLLPKSVAAMDKKITVSKAAERVGLRIAHLPAVQERRLVHSRVGCSGKRWKILIDPVTSTLRQNPRKGLKAKLKTKASKDEVL